MGHPAFPQGGMEFPHNFDPQGMMMPPVPPALGWYGTPMLNRPMGIGVGGNGVNPFWTPGTQARANQGMENQPSGARRVSEGSFNQVGEGMNSGMHRQENGDTERQNGLENENGNIPLLVTLCLGLEVRSIAGKKTWRELSQILLSCLGLGALEKQNKSSPVEWNR